MRSEDNRVYYAITPDGAYFCDERRPIILAVTGLDLSTTHYQPPLLTHPEEIARRLEGLRPAAHYRRIQVADRHTLDRVVRELRTSERQLDTQALAQVAGSVHEHTLPETAIHQESATLLDLFARYERAEVAQSHLLKKLIERYELANRAGNHESATLVMLLCMLGNHQLSFILNITKRERDTDEHL